MGEMLRLINYSMIKSDSSVADLVALTIFACLPNFVNVSVYIYGLMFLFLLIYYRSEIISYLDFRGGGGYRLSFQLQAIFKDIPFLKSK